MLFELWRWKPRLVWLIMHAATLGLLWCSLAWPTQAQFGALLATTAALYVSISFVDPGYVELASASAPVPDRASLSALTVPLVLQARVRHAAHTIHVQISTAHAHAMHLPCTCHARAMHMPCTRHAHATLQACDMCMVDKPPRAKHCYDCGRCVRRMDHHCWWLGNCVGQRTHRRFLFFLGAQSVLLWWTCGAAVCGVVSAAHGVRVGQG